MRHRQKGVGSYAQDDMFKTNLYRYRKCDQCQLCGIIHKKRYQINISHFFMGFVSMTSRVGKVGSSINAIKGMKIL